MKNGNRISEHFADEPTSAGASPLPSISEMGDEYLEVVKSLISQRPVVCLAGALAAGMMVAWFLKRTR